MRYVPQVAGLAAQTMVWVQKPLAPLLVDGNNAFSVSARDTIPPGEYDFACPLLSLPLVFGTSHETIPQAIPYLRSRAEASQKWHDTLVEVDGGNAYKVTSSDVGISIVK